MLGIVSAFDQSDLAAGRDVGRRVHRVDGQVFTFRADGEVFVDDEAAATWDVFGDVIEGP